MADPDWLHYHPGMLPYQERIRFTKEGTTRTSPDGLPKLGVRPVRSLEENSDGWKAVWKKYHV